MSARIEITVKADDGTTVYEYGWDQSDPQHAIERLGDGDGWKWANSHFGNCAKGRIDTHVGWGLVLAMRHTEAQS